MSDTDEEFCARVDVEQKMPRRSTRTRRRRHVFETETRETEAALRLALRISLGEKVDAEEAAAVARGERRKRRRQQTRRTVEVNTDGSTATSSTGNSGSDEIFTKPSRDLRFVPDAERYSVALPRVSSRGRRVKRTASFSVENAVHEEQIRRALALSLKEEEQRKRRQQLEAESQRLMCLKCGHSNSNSTERRRIIPCTGSVVRVRSFLPQFLRTNRHSLKDGENWQSLCCMHGKCDACLLEEVKLTDETAAESNGLFDTVRVTCPFLESSLVSKRAVYFLLLWCAANVQIGVATCSNATISALPQMLAMTSTIGSLKSRCQSLLPPTSASTANAIATTLPLMNCASLGQTN
ncbi:MAG: hypothetical protein MHM6MM_002602 [Cercozoa sp. M6MM]